MCSPARKADDVSLPRASQFLQPEGARHRLPLSIKVYGLPIYTWTTPKRTTLRYDPTLNPDGHRKEPLDPKVRDLAGSLGTAYLFPSHVTVLGNRTSPLPGVKDSRTPVVALPQILAS